VFQGGHGDNHSLENANDNATRQVARGPQSRLDALGPSLYMSRRIAANRVPERLRGDPGALSDKPLRAIWSGTSYPSRERFCCRATAQSQAQSSSIWRTRTGTQSRRSGSDSTGFGRAEFDTRVRQLVAGDQLIASLIDCLLRARQASWQSTSGCTRSCARSYAKTSCADASCAFRVPVRSARCLGQQMKAKSPD
jgi:hypothetical protein